jgi:cation-transporting ATPase 13A2
VKGQIFARMSPEQKHLLVEQLQNIGYCVGFCGDGANDCGALKAADIGLSLSETEASVAAPFTSKETELVCVPRLLSEGRAALVTSFSSFKYMALYSLLQFTTVTLLYTMAGNLVDLQFLYIDLLLIFPIATVMGRSRAHPNLSIKRPTASLMSKRVLTSMLGQFLIQMAFQIFIFHWVRTMPWYVAIPSDVAKKIYRSYENTALFLASCYQYIIVAIVFSVGPPFREKMIQNGNMNLKLKCVSIIHVGCSSTIFSDSIHDSFSFNNIIRMDDID